MDYKNTVSIDMLAQNTIKNYDKGFLKADPDETPIEELIEFNLGIKLIFTSLSHDKSVLGITVFEDCVIPDFNPITQKYQSLFIPKGSIVIDNSLLGELHEKQLKFTLAHELAHWLIHNSYYLKSADVANKSTAQSMDDIIENEADTLALSLLMPRGRVKVAYDRVRHKFKRDVAIFLLADIFNVSVSDITKRLENMNLIRVI